MEWQRGFEESSNGNGEKMEQLIGVCIINKLCQASIYPRMVEIQFQNNGTKPTVLWGYKRDRNATTKL